MLRSAKRARLAARTISMQPSQFMYGAGSMYCGFLMTAKG
jgi:hypothetical protein